MPGPKPASETARITATGRPSAALEQGGRLHVGREVAGRGKPQPFG